jgi:hypothetical protein
METRDRERVARVEIARLEAERTEPERELYLARADAEEASFPDAPFAVDISPQSSRRTGDVRAANRSLRDDVAVAMRKLPDVNESEPGARYCP